MPYISRLGIIKQIDLNAMLFFVVYMRVRKMSSVAKVLNCSNATVSIMLRRFSEDFSEELFERKTRSLTPTRFACDLCIHCERIMRDICDIYASHTSHMKDNRELNTLKESLNYIERLA